MKIINTTSSKFIRLFLILFVITAVSISFLFFHSSHTSPFFRIILTAFSLVLLFGFILAYYINAIIVHKTLIIIIFLTTILNVGYLILADLNVIEWLNSLEEIQEFIISTGVWGQIIFVLLQFIQVAFIPIPAMVTTLAGVAIYGPFTASILSTIGIILGSLFAFFVWGRLFGYKTVSWIAGKKTTDHYSELLNKKGRYLLILMFLFPIFPDDILCMIAGITKMKSSYFVGVTFLVRPISVFALAYFANGDIIPYSGWGLIAWTIILSLMTVAFVLTYKNHEKIESYLASKFKGDNKKKAS